MPKINWKVALTFYAAISVIFFFAFFYAAFNNNFPVFHQLAIAGNSNWPESWTVSISPARAFALTWGVARGVGLIVWILLLGLIALEANDLTPKWVSTKFWLVFVLTMLLSAALFYSNHSNVVSRNKVPGITPERYERIKDNKDSLENLFQKDHLIR